jgi:pectinesterase
MQTALERARRVNPRAALPPVDSSGTRSEQGIVYAVRGDRELRLDLFAPISTGKRRRPAILLIHGGGWMSGDRSMEVPMARRFARHGYVAAAVEYRRSPEARYPAALCDCREAVRWLRRNAEHYAIDPARIAVMGGSSGGHLAALLATAADTLQCGEEGVPAPIRAVVDVDGPVDLTDPSESAKDSDPARPSAAKRWLGFSYADRPELWKSVSPAFLVGAGTPPILFINSSEIRFSAGRDVMRARMRDLGIECEVVEIPDSPHTFWLLEPWTGKAFEAALAFLDRVVRSEKN